MWSRGTQRQVEGKMFGKKKILLVGLVLFLSVNAFGADVILNEYNAVAGGAYLNGGDVEVDDDGGRACDLYFGRILGNGGDWFELVVITDHLDMRNWKLDILNDGILDETLDLTNHDIWSDLRSGTIITVSEDLPSDISYNPAGGDWWINVQANNTTNGLYIEATNFTVHAENWQLTIRDSVGTVIFGPAGEGVSPASGVSDTEIFRLEANPSAAITPLSADYDDGDGLSTFGLPNQWGEQDFYQLRSVVAAPSTLTLLSPNGGEILRGGTAYDITWSYTGAVEGVVVDFSIDNGHTWTEVYPPNVGNEGSYSWLVPIVDSEQCAVRIRNAADLAVFDTSNAAFTIYECTLEGDLTGDCVINISDFAVMAAFWLECGNPYDLDCPQ